MFSSLLAISAASLDHQDVASQTPFASPELAGVGAGGAPLASIKFLHKQDEEEMD